MAERTPSIPLVDHELDEIRSQLIALGEWYGPRDSYSPGADLSSVVSIFMKNLVDAASIFLITKDLPEGLEGMGMTYQMADRLKSQVSQLKSLVQHLEQYQSDWLTFSEADRFGISMSIFVDTGDGEEADSKLEQFDSQLSETIVRSVEIKALLENAHKAYRKHQHRPNDYPLHKYTYELIHIGIGITDHDPGYAKSDQVTGPWVDYLLSAIKPLRPHTTPGAVAAQIDRWKRLRPGT